MDATIKIFNKFYNKALIVNANEYEVVKSFFTDNTSSESIAESFTESLFLISSETSIPVMQLLETFDNTDKLKINLTMAYYLNSTNKTKTVLYGVSNLLAPNESVQRNIMY